MAVNQATLVATVKNEGPYIWEWVAHHRAAGFDKIIIYQNDSDDLTHNILSTLRHIGAVDYFYNKAAPGRHQVKAYIRSAQVPAYQSAQWIMALDLDEFLMIKTPEGTIDSMIDAMPTFDMALINWHKFGCSGRSEIPAGLVTDNFVQAEQHDLIANQVEAFKAFYRREAYERPGVHQPRGLAPDLTPRIVNGSGLIEGEFELKNFQCSDPNMRAIAQVNHYMVRDAQSFVLKSARGSAHQSNRAIGSRYWAMRNKNDAEYTDIQRFRERTLTEMQHLDDLSGGRLERLSNRSLALHRKKFEELAQTPEGADLYAFCTGKTAAEIEQV